MINIKYDRVIITSEYTDESYLFRYDNKYIKFNRRVLRPYGVVLNIMRYGKDTVLCWDGDGKLYTKLSNYHPSDKQIISDIFNEIKLNFGLGIPDL